jgi:hypothetical protein
MRETIDMAREAGIYMPQGESYYVAFLEEVEHLVALVRADERNRTWTQEHWTEYERSIAAAEREACAKVCSELYAEGDMNTGLAADLIRNRGNT